MWKCGLMLFPYPFHILSNICSYVGAQDPGPGLKAAARGPARKLNENNTNNI
jgi:hypothetical protein